MTRIPGQDVGGHDPLSIPSSSTAEANHIPASGSRAARRRAWTVRLRRKRARRRGGPGHVDAGVKSAAGLSPSTALTTTARSPAGVARPFSAFEVLAPPASGRWFPGAGPFPYSGPLAIAEFADQVNLTASFRIGTSRSELPGGREESSAAAAAGESAGSVGPVADPWAGDGRYVPLRSATEVAPGVEEAGEENHANGTAGGQSDPQTSPAEISPKAT